MAPGEILAVVGESGSGKSVTALALMGLIPQPPGVITSDKILFQPSVSPKPVLNGIFNNRISHPSKIYHLNALSEKEMQPLRGKELSMIFQEPMTSLNPVFSCGYQLMEVLREHTRLSRKEAREKILELFGEVRLPDPWRIYRAYPHELSGGQKQRVMIAMAIACDPSLVIADEPTTALDVSVQKTIIDLLIKLQEERQMGLMFISHDLELVSRFAHRVLVMFHGEIVEQGLVSEVFTEPQHSYTRGLIACRPKPDIRVHRLMTITDFIEEKSEPVIENPEERKLRHETLYKSAPVLKVNGLKKVFQGKRGLLGSSQPDQVVLDRIRFSVYPGETLGIVGESGCGKTTLARSILSLIPPEEGQILYRDRNITQLNYQERKVLSKEIQIVFQDPYASLNPRMTIAEALMEPMKVHHLYPDRRSRMERAAGLLEEVGLTPGDLQKYPHQFSGGQRQRICIARALAVEPQMIICDESVSALDVSIQAQILNLLNDLKQTLHLTYIFISHDLQVVQYMSDKIIVMNQGAIVEMGDPDEIYHNPKSEYTKKLLDAR